MLKRIRNNPALTLSFLFFLLLLPAIACGSDAAPTKVGEVEQEAKSTPVVVDEEVTGDSSSPTDSAVTEPTDSPQPEPTIPPSAASFAVGDIVDLGDVSMIVLGWSLPTGDDFNKPEDGQKFVVVDVLFVNTGNSADSISTMLQTQLKDSTDQVYNIDFMASAAAGSSSPDGEIGPGERIRGSVGFQVPQDAKGLQFVFDSSVFGSGGRIFVDLGDEPIVVDVPAEITGETAATTFEVGDIIEIGNLGLIVNEVSFPAGDDFTQPDAGNKFIAVDLSITNNTNESQAISSLLQMNLKDGTGQLYDVDLISQVASGGTSPDGELAPGETLRGQVAYQIPVDAQDLVFVFDGDVFGSGKVFVSIPSE